MSRVLLYSLLLVSGLMLSQILPWALGPAYAHIAAGVHFLMMVFLSYIMIHVGFEFRLRAGGIRDYAWDYAVAATAAVLPWLFVAAYFVLALYPEATAQAWREALLSARFASPTSAGVLFSMLTAAGLAATWVFRKARILAIFDDLDTILLLIPLQMMMIGFRLELLAVGIAVVALLVIGWHGFRRLGWPDEWQWVLLYSFVIACGSIAITSLTEASPSVETVHFEVLLPAFVLGCMIRRPELGESVVEGETKRAPLEEHAASHLISGAFMLLVGMSMPLILGTTQGIAWGAVALHVLVITLLSNIGKLFPVLCYRKDASLRERLAVSIAMFPRGEVGAGVLIISLSYGVSSSVLLVAMLSLVLNLVLTGLFIWAVKRLIAQPAD